MSNLSDTNRLEFLIEYGVEIRHSYTCNNPDDPFDVTYGEWIVEVYDEKFTGKTSREAIDRSIAAMNILHRRSVYKSALNDTITIFPPDCVKSVTQITKQ